MKILSAKQQQALDAYTISHEPISHIDLMERAAHALTDALLNHCDTSAFALFCGPGNNGGDGLAVARLLHQAGKEVRVYDVRKAAQEGSASRIENLKRFKALGLTPNTLSEASDIPRLAPDFVVIDALFGSGLNRPLSGHFAEVVMRLNKLPNTRIALDIPSGLYADAVPPMPFVAFQAHHTLSLQFPKLCFFNRFTAPYVGSYNVLNIGLHKQAIADVSTQNHVLTIDIVRSFYKARSRFSYKQTYGHALLLAGAPHTFGAALISGKACLKGGVGLLDMAVPKGFEARVNVFLPEAMVLEDEDPTHLKQVPDLKRYQAIGIGPGLGQHPQSKHLLDQLLRRCRLPMVLDADALNMLAADEVLLSLLPENCILTPHIGEFKRLIGVQELAKDYLEQASTFAKEHQCVLVLKDSISIICTPEGERFFVDAGSAALATAGSGDVLCGLLLALLANGYSSINAAKVGVWLHAKAGAAAGKVLGEEGTLARDIPDFFLEAFSALK